MKKKIISLLLVAMIILQVSTPMVLGVEEVVSTEESQETQIQVSEEEETNEQENGLQETENQEENIEEQESPEVDEEESTKIEEQQVRTTSEQESQNAEVEVAPQAEQEENTNIVFQDEKIKQKLINEGADLDNNNEISIYEMEQVKWLEFYDEDEFDNLEDLEKFKNLQTLTFYNLYDKQLNLDAIAKVSTLKELSINGNAIQYNDFSFLENLTQLENLSISANSSEAKTVDLTGLGNYTNIKNLCIGLNVENIDEILKLINLESLSISMYNNQVDASLFKDLPKLKELNLNGNISNIEKIYENTTIESLSISPNSDNYEIDLAGIENMTNLKSLSMYGKINNIEYLKNISNLENLRLSIPSYTAITIDSKEIFNTISTMNLENINLYCDAPQQLKDYELGKEAKVSFEEIGGFLKSITTPGELLYDENYELYTYDENINIDKENKEIILDTKDIGRKIGDIYINKNNMNIRINLIWNVREFGDTETEINIPDENLKQYLLNNYDIDNNGKITEHDLINIEYLSLWNVGVTSLEGLEKAKNLKSLTLSSSCKEISAIASLTNLTGLNIYYMTDFDCSLLNNLQKLESLYVSNGKITNPEQIANLKSLQTLSLNNLNPPLTDISFIASLNNIKYLYLKNNKITDITPLEKLENLHQLDLTINPIDDQEENNARVLQELRDRNVYVQISEFDRTENITFKDEKFKQEIIDRGRDLNKDNEISIYEMEQMTELSCYNGEISCIEEIEYAKNLKRLGIYNLMNTTLDIEPISKLTNLESLSISGNMIDYKDFSILENLKELTSLSISHNSSDEGKMISLLGLGKYTNIKDLEIGGDIQNLEEIQKLVNLESLEIRTWNNKPIDANVITGLENLKKLELNGSITNIDNVYQNNSITDLTLRFAYFYSSEDKKVDLTGIEKMQQLNTLEIYGYLGNVTALSKLSNLNNLKISNYHNYDSDDNMSSKEILDIVKDLNIENVMITGSYQENIGIYKKGTVAEISFDEIGGILKSITTKGEMLYDPNYSTNYYGDQITIDNANRKIILNTDSIGEQETSFSINYKKNFNGSTNYENVTIYLKWKVYEDGDKETEINIPDSNLKQYLLEKHDIDENGKITEHDLINISKINIYDKGINSLEGLQYCSGLKMLNASYNNINDIAPIVELENLGEIYLDGNMLTDVSCLQNAKWENCYEETISLNNNFIDCTKGNANYNALKKLYYRDIPEGRESLMFDHVINSQNYGTPNKIDETVSLETNLKNRLIQIGVDTNHDNNITRRELYWVDKLIYEGKIDTIDLSNTNITNLSGLEYLNTWYINLSNNNITDITPIAKITKITYVDLSNNKITSINGIDNCKLLSYINLENNQIKDITPISNLYSVTHDDSKYYWDYGARNCYINLKGNQIVDISCVKYWKNLGELNLSNNKIKDISALKDYNFTAGGEYADEWAKYLTIDVSNNYIDIEKAGNKEAIKVFEQKESNLIYDNQTVLPDDDTYIGNINSQLISFNVGQSNGSSYVSGEIVVVEWVDGQSTVPKEKPIMKFKSTDGTINMDVFVTATGTNTYYFDRFIEGIDTSKEYVFEIASGDEKNVSANRSMNVYFTGTKYDNTIVGRYKDKKIRLLKQSIKFEDDTYIGNINSELKTFNVGVANNSAYVSGEIVVVEWVDGKSTVPEVAPKMRFKSTDGTINMEVFVTATGTNTYYFDRFIEGIDTSKEYYFEIESGDSRNVSENRSMNVYFTQTKYNDTVVGKYHDKRIRLLQQKILFEDDTYIGNINSELKTFNVGVANKATYVSGEIVVVEWVDGKSTVPEVAPKMRFKSTDGTVNMEVFVTATGTNTYYFDRFIEGIDTSKEYYFEIESGDSRNVSEYRSMNVYFTQTKYNDTIVGNYNEFAIRLLKQKIIFEK